MAAIIREGRKEDLPQVIELVRELAIFEKAEEQVTNTVEKMERDGFGDNPLFGFYVAEKEECIIGLSLYYFRYSTWKGKRLYLEDIIVTETERSKGFGKLLFERTKNFAQEVGCTGMTWQVLDWNSPAISFYKSYGAKTDNEWMNCNIEF